MSLADACSQKSGRAGHPEADLSAVDLRADRGRLGVAQDSAQLRLAHAFVVGRIALLEERFASREFLMQTGARFVDDLVGESLGSRSAILGDLDLGAIERLCFSSISNSGSVISVFGATCRVTIAVSGSTRARKSARRNNSPVARSMIATGERTKAGRLVRRKIVRT